MKVCIVTQPLHNNYGGVLQNYALQKALRDMGYEPITIDYVGSRPTRIKVLLSGLKTVALCFLGKKRPFLRINIRNRNNQEFVNKYLNLTRSVSSYNVDIVKGLGAEAVIVGSDQVWRARYNKDTLEDMYLKFLGNHQIKRIAYAASFGVDNMDEYTQEQIIECGKLLEQFDVVTVRESSGVMLCENYFRVKAEQVLDPTFLLKKEDYLKLCANVPIKQSKFLTAYILEQSVEKKNRVESIARNKNLEIVYFSAEANAKLSIEEWLAIFRDAEYIVTDSFHGVVFSIIFNKVFEVEYNANRGNTRVDSLLSLFGLHRSNEQIDWEKVNSICNRQIEFSRRVLNQVQRQ